MGLSAMPGSGTDTLFVTWKRSGGNETTEYIISVVPNDVNPRNVLHNSSIINYDTTITGLKPGVPYTVKVLARNDAGNGSEETASSCTSKLF